MKSTLSLLILLTLIAAIASATPPRSTPAHPDIQPHIDSLLHEDPAVRDAAATALIKLGPAVAGPLTAALAEIDSPEFHARVNDILRRCKSTGDIVNGLQLSLTADADTLSADSTVKLTTTITNTTAAPINLFVGMSYSGSAFEEGQALAVADDNGNALEPRWRVGFCGTGAFPLVITIPANGSREYTFPLTLKPFNTPAPQFKGNPPLALYPATGHRVIPLPGPRTNLRLRMTHAVSQKPQVMFGDDNVKRQLADPNAAFWLGQLDSNEIDLRLIIVP